MCGICGVVYTDRSRPVDKEMIRRMTDILKHRGPDGQGFHLAPGIGLGFRRLSIIDLETGDQPISNEDGTITVIGNGEIYNFRELREELIASGHRFRTASDIEVIVHLYEEQGVRCVERLRGMFGWALWDANRRMLMLARDRFGIKPLSYAFTGDAVLFGSEMKSILMAGGIERELDVHALHELFAIGFVLAPKTLFRSIRRLLPGHYLLFQDGKLSIHRYWDLRFPVGGEEQRRSAGEWTELLRAKLQESVRLHLRSDVPVGAWLSAGIDSSAIVSMMSQMTKIPIQTFSLSFKNRGFDEVRRQKILKDYPEYRLTNRQYMCTTEDFESFPKAIWHHEDANPSGIMIPRTLLSELAGRDVKVVLTGEGSDEVFGGYYWYRVEKLLRPLARLPVGMRQFLAKVPGIKRPSLRRSLNIKPEMTFSRYIRIIDNASEGYPDQLFSEDLTQQLQNSQCTEDEIPLPEEYHQWHPFAQLQYLELTIRLPDYINRTLDAASMTHSLEARVPFLDHELVELCNQIPPALKMRGLDEKHILREAMKGFLPRQIRLRRKRGLAAPYAQWIRSLPAFAVDILSDRRLRENGYFNSQFVQQMLGRHRDGAIYNGKHLMGVIGVQLWHDLFVKGCHF